MSGRRYLGWAGGVILVLGALTILLSVAVDPYRMYGVPALPGWTALKPRVYQRADIAKLYALERAAANTLLLGNSRVEVGFDPASARWPQSARPVFNAAEAGRGLFLAERLLQDAIAVHPPLRVILGLDFPDFLEVKTPPDTPLPPLGDDDRRLLVGRDGEPNPARARQVWNDRIATTLTINALLDSLDTLFDQNPQTSATMTSLGFNPLHEYRVFVGREGYHQLFAQKDAEYAAQYRKLPAPDFVVPEDFASFRYLERILAITRDHHIPLTLVIYPYHAHFLEMLHRLGLWQSFEAWKRALVRIVARPGGGDLVRLYDFSGYNPVSTEAVPPAGDRHSRMRWYWESGHFKAALGDLIIERVFGAANGFGVALDATDIDRVLNDIRADRDRYLVARSGAGADVARRRPMPAD